MRAMKRRLYAVLGLDKSATLRDIRRAYRAKARTAHPDAGGSPEEFARIRLAHDILSDPVKRLGYDVTGDETPPQADNITASAMEILNGGIMAFIQSDDPVGRLDFAAKLRHDIDGALNVTDLDIRQIEAKAKRADQIAARFARKRGDNFLARGARTQADDLRKMIAGKRMQRLVLEKAKELMEGYTFHVDPAPNAAQQNQMAAFGNFFAGNTSAFR